AYAIPEEFPPLVFPFARVDQQADPPSEFESDDLSALAQKLGYETVVVDGLELLQVPGLAPFRYYKNTVIQKRGVPTTETAHFAELVALFEKLGVRWDLAAARFPETQLKNIALFPEIVKGEEILVPRVIDLKDFSPPPGADQAITAEDHLRLHDLFENLPWEIAFLWKQADILSTEVAKLGQDSKSAQRDANLLVKLRNLLRVLMSIRELPIFVDAQPKFGYPHVDTTPDGIFYSTVDELVGDIESHVVHLQKYLAPAKFGAPPYGMTPINESVLLLKEQFRRTDRSIRTLQKATRYPVLARPSGYRVFVDMLNRSISNESFREAFLGKIGALGLNREITPLSNTGLKKIQTSLTRLLRNVRQLDRLEADNQLRVKEIISQLKAKLRWDVEQVINTNDLRQFPIQDTNNYFIQSVVASTTREMLLDVFGRLLEAGLDGVEGTHTEERIIRLIEGVDLIHRRLEELSRRSDYIFVMDEETSLIVAKLDIPIKAVDLAMTASLDDSLRERFRRFALHAVLPLHHLDQNAAALQSLISGGQTELTDTERT
ncbi:MAG: hypothetical protein K8I00_08715, partial [Candidatus Omnitrophica bacterium]|nr:hypothetical protein [Candidatus Omnitrophota bacterium]